MGKTTRVVVCGMKGVGKTALLEQLVYGNVGVGTETHPTIEDVYAANVETDRGTKEKLRFYDTAGLESPLRTDARERRQLPRHYLGFADGYVLVYDAAKPESLDALLPLKRDIDGNRDKKEITLIVVGNRTRAADEDSPSLESTTTSRAIDWCAREKVKHYELDVMDRSTLYEPFVHLSSRLNPPPNKTTFPQLSMGRRTVKAPELP